MTNLLDLGTGVFMMSIYETFALMPVNRPSRRGVLTLDQVLRKRPIPVRCSMKLRHLVIAL